MAASRLAHRQSGSDCAVAAPRFMADKDFQADYQKRVPQVESGYRETLTIAE